MRTQNPTPEEMEALRSLGEHERRSGEGEREEGGGGRMKEWGGKGREARGGGGEVAAERKKEKENMRDKAK